MSNIKIGNKTEKVVQDFFKNKKYWAVIIPKNSDGQPFDGIAMKKDIVWMFDIKHLDDNSNRFPISRIEPNQQTAMKYAKKIAQVDANVGFVISWKNELFWLDFQEEYPTSILMSELPPLGDIC